MPAEAVEEGATGASSVQENNKSGKATERRVIEQIRKFLGEEIDIVEQVKIRTVLPNGQVVDAVADYAYKIGDVVHFGEIKDGSGSRLSGNQKAVYGAIREGRVSIVGEAAARRLQLRAGVLLSKSRFILHAAERSRAARQALRLFGENVVRFAGSAIVLGLDLFLSTEPYDPWINMVDSCVQCNPAASTTVQ